MSVRQHDGHDPETPGATDHGSMAMYFQGGTHVFVLFKFWETTDTGRFWGALVGIFFLALFYEALKFYRDFLYDKAAARSADRSVQGLLGGINQNIFKSYHLIQTVLHMLQLVLSYFLMLIFMTYNVWLAIAITLGAGTGYLLFGWNKRSAVDITEHCH